MADTVEPGSPDYTAGSEGAVDGSRLIPVGTREGAVAHRGWPGTSTAFCGTRGVEQLQADDRRPVCQRCEARQAHAELRGFIASKLRETNGRIGRRELVALAMTAFRGMEAPPALLDRARSQRRLWDLVSLLRASYRDADRRQVEALIGHMSIKAIAPETVLADKVVARCPRANGVLVGLDVRRLIQERVCDNPGISRAQVVAVARAAGYRRPAAQLFPLLASIKADLRGSDPPVGRGLTRWIVVKVRKADGGITAEQLLPLAREAGYRVTGLAFRRAVKSVKSRYEARNRIWPGPDQQQRVAVGLLELGWSGPRIARETGLARRRVDRIREQTRVSPTRDLLQLVRETVRQHRGLVTRRTMLGLARRAEHRDSARNVYEALASAVADYYRHAAIADPAIRTLIQDQVRVTPSMPAAELVAMAQAAGYGGAAWILRKVVEAVKAECRATALRQRVLPLLESGASYRRIEQTTGLSDRSQDIAAPLEGRRSPHALSPRLPTPAGRTPTIARIQSAVADHYEITVEDLKSKRPDRDIIFPRQVAMYLARSETSAPLRTIARAFGDRHHSIAVRAVGKILQRLDEHEEQLGERLENDIQSILRRLYAHPRRQGPGWLATAAGPSSPLPRPDLRPVKEAARIADVAPSAIRNYLTRGWITRYPWQPGGRGIRGRGWQPIDINEVIELRRRARLAGAGSATTA